MTKHLAATGAVRVRVLDESVPGYVFSVYIAFIMATENAEVIRCPLYNSSITP
jgi:hypothetical protein